MLVQACLNGGRSKGDHPAVPITPDELAADAERVVEAGAEAIHVHPRGPGGVESLEPAAVASAVAAVRAAVPAVPVGVTTAAWIEPDRRRRVELIAAWDARPDFASVNVSEDGWKDVASALLDRDIGVEAGLVSVDEARGVAASSLASRFLRILVEPIDVDPTTAARTAEEVDRSLDDAGLTLPRLHHGFGPATWTVLSRAIASGRDIRVGFEDTLTLPDGSAAPNNAALVAAARALIDA